jgi:D-alanyl-D-alanine carboxypeptidase
MTYLLKIGVVFVCTVSILACSTEDDPTPFNPDIYVDAAAFFESIDFQGTVLIKRGSTDVLRSGFGYANAEGGIWNTPTTKFRIGSVSKTFTGMGVIQLWRDGLLTNLDQPLSDFDPEFPRGDEITIYHLLTHQSGLPDYVGPFEDLAKSGEYFDPEDIYEVIAESVAEEGLEFTPGQYVQYSNSNFLLAALLIQELSGQVFYTYIQEKVLQPLGMDQTEPGANTITGTDYAQGYHGQENASDYPMYIALGAGDWTSTVADLEKWCSAVMGDQWFSPAEKDLIFGGDVPDDATAFGVAWFKSRIDGQSFFWHGGDIDGFSALIGFVPAEEGIVITLSNQQDDTGQTRNQIIETILKEEF